MKKIISVFACVCLLLSVVIVPVFAAETTATITFDDPAKATWSAEQQAWTENGITVTNNKAASTTNIDVSKKYSNPARFYKASEVIIEYPGMTKVVIDATTANGKDYAAPWKDSLDASVGTATVSGDDVTITLNAPTDKLVFSQMTAQARAYSITVYADSTAPTPPAVDDEEDDDVNVPSDPMEIVDAAFELGEGESLPYIATLIGEVTYIEEEYNAQYDDISVWIMVEGTEYYYEMLCIYLQAAPGEDASLLQVGDIIEVTGTISNYYGIIEFDEGSTFVLLDSSSGYPSYGDGTADNPGVVNLVATEWDPTVYEAEAYLEFYEGDPEYYFSVKAPADGLIGINISAYDYYLNSNVGYKYSVTNLNSSSDTQYVTKAADEDNYNHYELVYVSKGDELIICASTYDANNVLVAPEAELGLYMCFYPVGSIECPEVLEQTGKYTATFEEAAQGRYYTWTVPADGTVTVTMNDSTGWNYRVNKAPVDVDDTANYYYSYIHYFDDENVVASESINVLAGETIDIWVNTFNPEDPWVAPAGSVNWTLEFNEKTQGIFSIDNVDATAGEEFTVAVNISENPGIIGAKLNVNYDVSLLELVDVQVGDFANNFVGAGDDLLSKYHFSENLTDCPFMINWIDPLATENINTNGVFAYLTFKVKSGANTCDTQICIELLEDDIYDKNLNRVQFVAINSNVNITAAEQVAGDVDGDGVVDARDCAKLMQYINGWSNAVIDEENADVNADGKISARDYVLLVRYINGWDVVLK